MPERITLDAAREALGIERPVRVELHAAGGQARASYLGIVDGSHRIKLNVGRKTKVPRLGTTVFLPDRNESLWHELTHALQCERDFDGDSPRAREHYAVEFAKALGVTPEEISTPGYIHERVEGEFKAHGVSATVQLYVTLPWEAEAYAAGETFAPEFEVVFPVSRKTPRGAKRMRPKPSNGG